MDEVDLDMHFVKENFVLNKESRSSEKLAHGIKVLMARNYVDNLSEEVRKGTAHQGGPRALAFVCALGYVNVDGPDGKRIIVPDPILGPMMTDLFSWFATTEYSLKRRPRKPTRQNSASARARIRFR